MKTIAIFFVALMLGLTMQAQTFSEKSSGGGFDVESGVKSADIFVVDGKTFDVYETANGSAYVKGISSKTGKPYAIWIGADSGKDFNGQPVRVFSSGSYAYFKISKSGYPYARWLTASE